MGGVKLDNGIQHLLIDGRGRPPAHEIAAAAG